MVRTARGDPAAQEEASVAGESPDKSEQQKSSGTARSEGDPRLAAFREPASPAESGGKKDTATAVFRTKPVENGEDAEHAEGVDGTENASEGPEAASTPSGPAEPEEGDARLRAAVAAWVGKGDDDAAGAAAEEPEAADDADDAAKPETVAESDTSAPHGRGGREWDGLRRRDRGRSGCIERGRGGCG